jgi:hypothetical protein
MAECDCGITGIYRVLATAPKTEKTGEASMSPEGLIRWHRVVEWRHLGYADSYEDARARFGGRPVLELIGRLQ